MDAESQDATTTILPLHPFTLYKLVFPSASGIELMLLGGIKPTSVTTAVMHVGGVKSYNGFRISRFGM
jgi:hypothetical protein